MNFFINASVFLIRILFNIYLLILMLRVILQWAGANYYNSVVQLIVKLTDPLVQPLRRIIPPRFGIDFATVTLLFLVELLMLILLSSFLLGGIPNIFILIFWSVVDLINLAINIFFYAIILAVIFSWLAGMVSSPFIEILHLISEPLLKPARRIIPPIAGFDISPIPVLIILKLFQMLVLQGFISIVGSSLISST